MNKFLTANEKYRKQMIEHVRKSLNLPPQSIEKDLWVTQVLHALFSLEVSDKLIFKGGTSLSKAWVEGRSRCRSDSISFGIS